MIYSVFSFYFGRYSMNENNAFSWSHRCIKLLQSAFAILTITSCTPSIDQKEPKIALSDVWRETLTICDNSSIPLPIVSTEEKGLRTIFYWWEVYQDNILNTLEQEALKNSPTLEAATYRFEEAVWTLGIHESDLYPTLDLSASASRQRIPTDLQSSMKIPTATTVISTPVPPPGITPAPVTTTTTKTVKGPEHYNLLNPGLVVNYEVDLWGKLRLKKDSYAALAKASLEDVQAIQLLLTYQVAKLYNTIRYYETDIRMAYTLLKYIEEEAYLSYTRYSSGINDLDPYLEIEAKKDALIAEIADLTDKKNQATVGLAILLGKEPSTFQLPNADATWTPVLPPTTLPTEVLQERPDVRRSLREIDSLIAQIGVAKTEYFPSLSITGFLGYESLKANRLFKWKNRMWSIGSILGMRLLDAGKRESEVNSAISAYNVKAQEHIHVCLTAIQEVENALSLYNAQNRATLAFINQNTQRNITLSLTAQRFASGINPYQHVIAAQQQKITSLRSTLQSEFALQLASLDLIKAIGGSWKQ